ncbi:PKD domain-containing protein [Candidatus Micrarchaeota archaeon]|nr:PKD domain-containing protein [Candidatus Micrarchaeota archaeon]
MQTGPVVSVGILALILSALPISAATWGAPAWQEYGLDVSQMQPWDWAAISDEAGGAVAVWSKFLSGTAREPYFQRVYPDGTRYFANGILLAPAFSDWRAYDMELIKPGTGARYYAVWTNINSPNGGADDGLWVQRFNGNTGALLFGDEGIQVTPLEPYAMALAGSGTSNAYIAFVENSAGNGASPDLYLAQVTQAAIVDRFELVNPDFNSNTNVYLSMIKSGNGVIVSSVQNSQLILDRYEYNVNLGVWEKDWSRLIASNVVPTQLTTDENGGAVIGFEDFDGTGWYIQNVGWAWVDASGNIADSESGTSTNYLSEAVLKNNAAVETRVSAYASPAGFGRIEILYDGPGGGQAMDSYSYPWDNGNNPAPQTKISLVTDGVQRGAQNWYGSYMAYEMREKNCNTGSGMNWETYIVIKRVDGGGTRWSGPFPNYDEDRLVLSIPNPNQYRATNPLAINAGPESAIVFWTQRNPNRVYAQKVIEAANEYVYANAIPGVSGGGPYSGNVGEEVALDGTVTEGNAVAFEWSVFSGNAADCIWNPNPNVEDPGITCNSVGTRGLALRAQNANGLWSGYACTSVTFAAGGDPVADAGPDQELLSLETMVLDGSGSTDPDGTIVAYRWRRETGNLPIDCSLTDPDGESGSLAQLHCTDDHDPAIIMELEVEDNDGKLATDTMNAKFLNRLPVADASGNGPGVNDQDINVQGTVIDEDGILNPAEWISDAGQCLKTAPDTYFPLPPWQANMLVTVYSKMKCSAEGSFPIRLTVTDDDNGYDEDSFDLLISSNAPPIANAWGDYSGAPNTEISIYGTADDNSAINTMSWAKVFGPGNCVFDTTFVGQGSPTASLNGTITCDAEGSYGIQLKVSDGDGAQASDNALVNIGSAPSATFEAVQPAVVLLDCPRLTYQETTQISVQCLDNGVACETDQIVITGAPATLSTQDGHVFIFDVETLTDGEYPVVADAGFDASSCTIRKVGKETASFPETHPFIIALVVLASMAVVRLKKNK